MQDQDYDLFQSICIEYILVAVVKWEKSHSVNQKQENINCSTLDLV